MITQRTIQANTARWKAISKHAYCNQPTDLALSMILDAMAKLNKLAKHPDFPIAKTPFYRIKAALIRWCIMQAKLGNANIKYSIDDFEVRDNAKFVSLYLTLNGLPNKKTYHFHQPFISPLRWILWDEVENYDAVPYRNDDGTIGEWTVDDCIKTWKFLLSNLESSNWFIFDDLDPVAWMRTMHSIYKGAFDWRGHGCFKLSVALSGGPLVTFKNGYACKAGFFWRNFLEVAVEGDIFQQFDLKLK